MSPHRSSTLLLLPLAASVLVTSSCAGDFSDGDGWVGGGGGGNVIVEPWEPAPLVARSLPNCEDIAQFSSAPPASFTLAPVGPTGAVDGALRIVFVPEGYAAGDGAVFADDTERYLAALRAPGGLVVKAPLLFRFERVLPDELPEDGRSFASCLMDYLDGSPRMLHVDLAAAWAATPDADVVVVVVNSELGRANAPYAGSAFQYGTSGGDPFIEEQRSHGRSVLLSRHDGPGVLTHELGHALFDLDDEYTEFDACFPGADELLSSADVLAPNLTLDPSGAKWAALVDGAVAGGARYASCVFHPGHTEECIMHSASASSFCPVCEAQIARVLLARAGSDADAPRCQMVAREWGDDVFLSVEALDETPPVTIELFIGGARVARAQSEHARLSRVSLLTLTLDELAQAELGCVDGAGNDASASWAAPPVP